MLRELLDDAVEPFVHAAQLRAQTLERRSVAHVGGGEILVARVVAREFDARVGELAGDELGLGKRRGRGGRRGIGLGAGLGLRPAAVHPERDDGGERAARRDQRAPGEDVGHGVTA